MAIEPYLFFNGRCEEAIEFDKKTLGAEVLMVMRYKESPKPPLPGKVPADWDNKIMHTSLRIGNANVMASDGRSRRRRTGADAVGQDLFFTPLRDGR